MKLLRTIAERLSRGRVIRRRILVNGKSIPLLVSPDAQLKYLKWGKQAFDQDLIEVAEKFVTADSNVWDIGANVGVFTFAASCLAHQGTVVAVEADIWLAGILRRTALFKEYSSQSILVLPAAVSNVNAVASFVVASRGRASSALEFVGGRSQSGGGRETQLVPTLTLDTMLNNFPVPDFVKIDVEGAEYMVLEGASRLINHIRPKFYIEVGADVSAKIMTLFRSAGYTAYDSQGIELRDKCAFNTFFIPSDT